MRDTAHLYRFGDRTKTVCGAPATYPSGAPGHTVHLCERCRALVWRRFMLGEFADDVLAVGTGGSVRSD